MLAVNEPPPTPPSLFHCNEAWIGDGERKGRREDGGEEVAGMFAPVSTTGILGLIIQMSMLLLENTRSRVEAIASTIDL